MGKFFRVVGLCFGYETPSRYYDNILPPFLDYCCLLIALERDCLSGYGILIYLITKDGIAEYDLASRND